MHIRIVGLTLLVLPVALHAQIYTCTDKQGKFISADQMIAECADREIQVLDKNGRLVQTIPAPLTPAQKQAAQQKKQQQQATQDQAREDQAILLRYRSREDIEAARKNELETLDAQLKSAQSGLAQAKQQLQAAQANAQSGKDNPTVAQKRVRDAQFILDQQQTLVVKVTADKQKANARYDDMATRFDGLKSGDKKLQQDMDDGDETQDK